MSSKTERSEHPARMPSVNPMSLEGRSIIITGAGQGIGRAVATLVLLLGGNVMLADLNARLLEEAQADLGAERVAIAAGNVTEPSFAARVVEQAVARFGAVHGLVNNAGIVRAAMIEKMTIEQWHEVIEVHLTGAFIFLQEVGRHMLARAKAGEVGSGSIVNISSNAGVQGTMGQINYGAAKAGILGATMSAAREWAKYGIRVNAVAFGVVETQMTDVVRGEKYHDATLAKIPLGRWSTAQEAAKPICFLLSDAASYITGQRLSANGGSQMSP